MKKLQLIAIVLLIEVLQGISQTENLISEKLELNPPQNLTGNIFNYDDLQLVWEPPGTYTEQWIQWDNGVNNGNAVGASGGSFFVASHWTSSDLTPYHGMALSKISFFPKADENAIYNLFVWLGPDAANEVLSKPVNEFTIEEWNEIDLDTAILIDSSVELWFGYSVNHQPGLLPAGCDEGPAIEGKGNMFSINGSTWMSFPGLDGNWNLAGFIESADKKEFLGYNVYKNGEIIGFTADTAFIEENLTPETFEYHITAAYDEGESLPSNSVWITGPPPCNPPVNVVAQVGNFNSLHITWEPPSIPPLGYNLYRNNELICFTTALSYFDSTPESGTVEFCVTAVCDGCESLPGCADSITILNLPPPQDFVLYYDEGIIWLEWETPVAPGLNGFNNYHSLDNVPFEIIETLSFDCTNWAYSGVELGLHSFFLTALYDEGESPTTDTLSILITSLQEHLDKRLIVYPNPVKEEVIVSSGSIIKSVCIYNTFGQLMKNQNVNDNNFSLNVSNINPGVYFLKIELSEGFISKRIIIE